MKNKSFFSGGMFASIGAAAVTAYMAYVLGQHDERLYTLFVFTAISLAAAYYFKTKRDLARLLEEVVEFWGSPITKKRNLNTVRRYFDAMKDKKKQFYIDDQTWQDLNMDEIYTVLDRNLTTAGEQVLYDMLRRPLLDREPLLARNRKIKLFQEDKALREKLQIALQNAGRLKEDDILDILLMEHEYNPYMRMVCYLATAAPILILAAAPFVGSAVIMPFVFSLGLNVYIHINHAKKNGININSIGYLVHLIKAAGIISKIESVELKSHLDELGTIFDKVKRISKGIANIGVPEGADVIYDYVKIELLIEERSYYRVINDVVKYRNDLIRMYDLLGELDSLLSIASYREEIEDYSEPEFIEGGRVFDVKGLFHPLLQEPVANDIYIKNGGIIITGSNMSGKSTFLRAAGVAATMAQTIYTVTCDSYVGSFFKIMTSISPGDNIMGGKSYYLGEAEAILRIIRDCNPNMPILCIVDEIFRGTNPVERISASVEILNYLLKNNVAVLVATHDLELTEVLKAQYECYYFTESVDKTEGLQFDYIMRKGVSPTRNAIKVLSYLGYPEAIVNGAEKRSLNA